MSLHCAALALDGMASGIPCGCYSAAHMLRLTSHRVVTLLLPCSAAAPAVWLQHQLPGTDGAGLCQRCLRCAGLQAM
jgi:hypothetical protein